MRTCSIEGCENKHYSRGWCPMHYQRWRRHEDPLMVKPRTPQHVTKHGTMNEYQNFGCRCELCRSAWAKYYAERVRGVCPKCGGAIGNRYDSDLCKRCYLLSVAAPHGTESRYTNGECRCDLCRAAAAKARRERRHSSITARLEENRKSRERRRARKQSEGAAPK